MINYILCIDIKQDYEMIKSFAEFWSRIARKYNALAIVQSKYLKTMIMLFSEFLMSTVENDANTEIVFFLNDLIWNESIEIRNAIADYTEQRDSESNNIKIPILHEYIGTAFIVAIPNMRSIVSQTFAKCLAHICKEYPDIIETCVHNAFQNEKFSDVQNLKEPLIKFLLGFRSNSRQFKMTIIDFQAIMRGTASADIFISREIQLQKMNEADIEVIE